MQHHYSYPENRYILIGVVIKAQGLRGEVSIHAVSGQPENLRTYPALTLVDKQGGLSPRLTVTGFRVQKGRAVILFDGVTDRSHAEQLAGMGVLLDKKDLPQLAPEEFYWHELTGLPVRTVDGRSLGCMQSVFSNGAQDVMVIGDEDREYMIPLMPGIIVGQNSRELVIDPPPGLLEINIDDDETDETDAPA